MRVSSKDWIRFSSKDWIRVSSKDWIRVSSKDWIRISNKRMIYEKKKREESLTILVGAFTSLSLQSRRPHPATMLSCLKGASEYGQPMTECRRCREYQLSSPHVE